LAARYYLDRGYETIGHVSLREARYCYLRWGADGKVRQLDQRYPNLHEERAPAELPESLLRYVVRTQESVILDDSSLQNRFSEDDYLRQRRSRSVLCTRVSNRETLPAQGRQCDLGGRQQYPAEAVRDNDRQVIEAGVPIQFEETVPSDGGERVYVSARFLLRDRTGKPYAVCGVATDITELKRLGEMQAALARERELFCPGGDQQRRSPRQAYGGKCDTSLGTA